MSDWGDIDSFCNKYGFYQGNPVEEMLSGPNARHSSDQQVERFENIAPSGLVAPNGNEPNQSLFCPGSSELVGNSSKEFKDVKGANLSDTNDNRTEISQKLSTEQILRLAGERFVQFSSQKFININMLIHPYGSCLSGLPVEDKQDVELAQLLLAAAEKVGHQQVNRASKLLNNCQWIASNTGTPVQRAVFYFAEALMERINKETGTSEEKPKMDDSCKMRNILPFLAMHQELPFFQVLHFTIVQTILENVAMKSKVHLIDFHILTGLPWAALMQAITEQNMDPGGYLKITAIETVDKHRAEKTGKLLQSFASHLNLSFHYKIVFLSDIKDLTEDDFDIQPEESVAILFPFMLRTLISKPICLKNLMVIAQKIKPSIVVVGEVEANHNSPSFVNRFTEALFFYGALFDSLEDSMARDNEDRLAIESGTFRDGIRNIVATEGHERLSRSVSISVWRAFFARYGMMELELSTASLYQACLIVNQFPCGKSCTLDMSSKCLLVGWKGTPLFSLSAWKFH